MINQKDKEEGLVEEYAQISKTFVQGTSLEYYKQSALIAVDYILSSIEVGFEDYKSLSKINYWKEVKQEIEKL